MAADRGAAVVGAGSLVGVERAVVKAGHRLGTGTGNPWTLEVLREVVVVELLEVVRLCVEEVRKAMGSRLNRLNRNQILRQV